MKTVYIGCAIKHAPVGTEEFVQKLRKELHKAGLTVLEYVGTDPNVSSREVYMQDIKQASSADIMIAICDNPSTGMGMEIQKRIELGKKLYIAHKKDSKISRMCLGLVEEYDFVHLLQFDDVKDIVKALG